MLLDMRTRGLGLGFRQKAVEIGFGVEGLRIQRRTEEEMETAIYHLGIYRFSSKGIETLSRSWRIEWERNWTMK